MKKITSVIILILVVGLAFVGWFVYANNQESQKIESTGGSFENQWVKFNYPPDLTIGDASTNDHVDITIYNGTKEIGSINDYNSNIDEMGTSSKTKITMINGRDALVGYVGSVNFNLLETSAFVALTDNSILEIEIFSSNKPIFDKIMNTIVIKKGKINTTKTYSNHGIIFNYPAKWGVEDYSNEDNIIGNLSSDSLIVVGDEDGTQIQIQIMPTSEKSDQEAIKETQSSMNVDGTKISNITLKIDNNMAYGGIYRVNDLDSDEIIRTEELSFVKNGKVYDLIIQAPNSKFDKEKANFDMILKTFKIH
ncbi:hypothetical protein [Methanobacterium oryzae]|uniref:hypothetical protein n=1 Tax=Methanobacterium oryzae TaxID=69540 RepID=UPI003D23999C